MTHFIYVSDFKITSTYFYFHMVDLVVVNYKEKNAVL